MDVELHISSTVDLQFWFEFCIMINETQIMQNAINPKFYVHDVFGDSTHVHVAPLTRGRMTDIQFTLAQ
jgi:hypothetical protein